jgi:NAD-dependent SIR2 family protein deacetylase
LTEIEQLSHFIDRHRRLLVITGAGLSVNAGIPTYRDDSGTWQRSEPIMHQQFINQHEQRQRYWSRSTRGWPMLANAKPSLSHHYLAWLEKTDKLKLLVTQNVDRLHQQAGNQRVIDLHGRVDRTICLSCSHYQDRNSLQAQLLSENPQLQALQATPAPDGDADISDYDTRTITYPSCSQCGGIIMPDVVFYGGNVPKARHEQIAQSLAEVDGVLILGSSLMVYSAFRICKAAAAQGIPIAAVNRGITRADDLLALKLSVDCDEGLMAKSTFLLLSFGSSLDRNSEL